MPRVGQSPGKIEAQVLSTQNLEQASDSCMKRTIQLHGHYSNCSFIHDSNQATAIHMSDSLPLLAVHCIPGVSQVVVPIQFSLQLLSCHWNHLLDRKVPSMCLLTPHDHHGARAELELEESAQ